MSILEIALLIAGGVIFVLSFVIPTQKEGVSEDTKELVKEEIEALVVKEMDSIKGHVEDVVDEAVEYAMEKTERSLERLSNEKIMAVNEYSDTVLQEIHRNHEEVVFLYDMLNDKHTNLKNTVTEVNKTVKKAAETKKEAEEVVNSFQKLTPDKMSSEGIKVIKGIDESDKETEVAANPRQDVGKDSNVTDMEDGKRQNNNEKILQLYRQGKTKVAIAQELGLGVGEVKLVIDLYQNM